MERVLSGNRISIVRTVVPIVVLGALIFSAIVIAYGMESVAPGVHDAFHDFRHAIGMPCH